MRENQKPARSLRRLILLVILTAVVAGGYFSSPHWLPLLQSSVVDDLPDEANPIVNAEVTTVKMSEQACANLGLCSALAEPQSYWRKIQTTGVIVDRPGFTDRGITSPVDSIVVQVHAFEGDIVRPGQKLFTMRLASEYLQKTQSDFFKALRETEILNKEIARISGLADTGVIPEKRVIDLRQEISRQTVFIEAHRQDLLARGLNEIHLKQIEKGNFVKTIDVVAPEKPQSKSAGQQVSQISFEQQSPDHLETLFELQELKVELGQQVHAGEVLAVLANHHDLYINGHAFKKEATNIARAAELGWGVEVEFIEDESGDWPALDQSFQIRHLANTIDIASRTFDFFIPLTNQSRSYTKNDRDFVIWRFRPGQRVRIHVPVEKLENVIVVASEAVVADGPNTYVFQQNGDFYNRIPVHVVYRDRLNTVIANDGSILPGFFLAKNSAASLNRVLKAQQASGSDPGFHVHADGSVHSNSSH